MKVKNMEIKNGIRVYDTTGIYEIVSVSDREVCMREIMVDDNGNRYLGDRRDLLIDEVRNMNVEGY